MPVQQLLVPRCALAGSFSCTPHLCCTAVLCNQQLTWHLALVACFTADSAGHSRLVELIEPGLSKSSVYFTSSTAVGPQPRHLTITGMAQKWICLICSICCSLFCCCCIPLSIACGLMQALARLSCCSVVAHRKRLGKWLTCTAAVFAVDGFCLLLARCLVNR